MRLGLGLILRAMGRNVSPYASLVIEVALGLAVVVHALVLGRWFIERCDTRPLDLDHTMGLSIERLREEDLDSQRRRLARLPNVVAVSAVDEIPLTRRNEFVETVSVGSAVTLTWTARGDTHLPASFGARVVARDPAARQEALTAVVSKSLARTLFGAPEAAVGRRLDFPARKESVRIAAVIEDLLLAPGYAFMPENLTLLLGTPNRGPRSHFVIHLAAVESAASVTRRARQALALSDTEWAEAISLRELHVINSAIGINANRIFMVMVGLVLLVVLLGSFGMSTFLVSTRTRQIGIRRALGATRIGILQYFLLENFLATSFGLALGIGATYLLNVIVRNSEMQLILSADLLVVGMLLFWCTGLLAAFGPAWRGAKVPPHVASRVA